MTRNNTELEYKALSNTTVGIQWNQSLPHDLHITLTNYSKFWCGNIIATYISSNLVFYARTRCIEIDFYFANHQVLQKELQVFFLWKTNMLTCLLKHYILLGLLYCVTILSITGRCWIICSYDFKHHVQGKKSEILGFNLYKYLLVICCHHIVIDIDPLYIYTRHLTRGMPRVIFFA